MSDSLYLNRRTTYLHKYPLAFLLITCHFYVNAQTNYEKRIKNIYDYIFENSPGIQKSYKERPQFKNDSTENLSIYPAFIDIDYSGIFNHDSIKKIMPDLPAYTKKESGKKIFVSDTGFIKHFGDLHQIKSDYNLFISPPQSDYLICELVTTLQGTANRIKYLWIFRFDKDTIKSSFNTAWKLDSN